ncbi:NAD(P)H-binding protein [Streptomyces sp. NPDC006365]|uniref:NAD(P)H-binding protein n=1 Tax=Streptomyces sp. NPDC006365 TaxID=3364744 RepID=UPI0036C7F564
MPVGTGKPRALGSWTSSWTGCARERQGEGDDRKAEICGDVSAAVFGQEAVVSALGAGGLLVAKECFTRMQAAVIGAAKQQEVSRLVWMSSFSARAPSGRRPFHRRSCTSTAATAAIARASARWPVTMLLRPRWWIRPSSRIAASVGVEVGTQCSGRAATLAVRTAVH